MKVKDLLDRYVAEMNGTNGQPGVKPLSQRENYHFAFIRRLPIAEKEAETLTRFDIIEQCKERRAKVSKATVLHDLRCLTAVFRYAGSAWLDCDGVTLGPIAAAKPFMIKHEIIGRGNARTRVPTEDELDRLLTYFEAENKRGRAEIDMVPLILFGLVSTRRRGEVVRIRRSDIDWQKMTYMVRDMKHPNRKIGNHGTFALLPELVEIIKTLPVIEDEDRLFPYNGNVVGQKYCAAKKSLGILDLRLHDNRRAAITKWLSILKSPHRVKLISGHKTTHMIERVYDVTDPGLINQDLVDLGVTSILNGSAASRMPS